MKQATPTWKVFLVAISVLLTVLVWTRGLQESLGRPSVSPALNLRQQEMTIIAASSLPDQSKNLFFGIDPKSTLQNSLEEIPLNELGDRNRLLLALLETSKKERIEILNQSFESEDFQSIKEVLISSKQNIDIKSELINKLKPIKNDQLLYQLACFKLGGDEGLCVNKRLSFGVSLKLIISQLVPLCAIIIGIVLLIKNAFSLIRRKLKPNVLLISMPLSLVDMLLLVTGGFVVLGEVLFPSLVSPFSDLLVNGLTSPKSDSIKVLIGYISMTIPSLFILYRLINSLDKSQRPKDGWLQWRFFPLKSAFLNALQSWLMVLPLVLLTAWVVTTLFGDQGGSNPLLELVLSSKDPFALLLLLITTIVLAPVFEEIVFRGALLPVLANRFDMRWGVIVSAFVFAVAHLSVGELAPLFVLGIGLAILRLRSGRLFPCILMHSLWNGITFANLILIGG